jgi:hypothetical protein
MKTQISPFPRIETETRIAVDTATAAHHLNRRPQTLRAWSCNESGPIRPIRIYGRLAWPVCEIRRLLRMPGDSPCSFATPKTKNTASDLGPASPRRASRPRKLGQPKGRRTIPSSTSAQGTEGSTSAHSQHPGFSLTGDAYLDALLATLD